MIGKPAGFAVGYVIDPDTKAGSELGFTSIHGFQGSLWFMPPGTIYIQFIKSRVKGNFATLCQLILDRGMTIKITTIINPRMLDIVTKQQYSHGQEFDQWGDKIEVWTKKPALGIELLPLGIRLSELPPNLMPHKREWFSTSSLPITLRSARLAPESDGVIVVSDHDEPETPQ